MAHVVKHLIPREHKVIPLYQQDSSGYFVRDKSAIFKRIEYLLIQARRDRWGRTTDLKGTEKHLIKLCRELRGGPAPPALRVLEVVEWYAGERPWHDNPMVVWVDGGKSLYEKFHRLEAGMVRLTGGVKKGETPIDIFERLLGDPQRVDVFVRTILPAAVALRLVSNTCELATALVTLFENIVERRARANLTSETVRQLGGPTDLVRRYLVWIADQDWTATVRVLNYDSNAFRQFCRETARADVRDRDPITGKAA